MALYSYVLDHDYGFAPNPFHGVCTLATCKPQIRARATVGDHIVGTGCKKRGRQGRLVFFMIVDEITTYDAYWVDPRFGRKRPFMTGSRMDAFGDNIYHRSREGAWLQEGSFHSLPDGSANSINRDHDTHAEEVLIAERFAYWGGSGPSIPQRFREWCGDTICAGRAYRRHFGHGLEDAFLCWLRGLDAQGVIGRPADWARTADSDR